MTSHHLELLQPCTCYIHTCRSLLQHNLSTNCLLIASTSNTYTHSLTAQAIPSLPHTLPHTLTPSPPHTLTTSLPHHLTHSPPHHLTHLYPLIHILTAQAIPSLPHLLTPSPLHPGQEALLHTLPYTLTHSPPHSLTSSLPHLLTPSPLHPGQEVLPQSLTPSPPHHLTHTLTPSPLHHLTHTLTPSPLHPGQEVFPLMVTLQHTLQGTGLPSLHLLLHMQHTQVRGKPQLTTGDQPQKGRLPSSVSPHQTIPPAKRQTQVRIRQQSPAGNNSIVYDCVCNLKN